MNPALSKTGLCDPMSDPSSFFNSFQACSTPSSFALNKLSVISSADFADLLALIGQNPMLLMPLVYVEVDGTKYIELTNKQHKGTTFQASALRRRAQKSTNESPSKPAAPRGRAHSARVAVTVSTGTSSQRMSRCKRHKQPCTIRSTRASFRNQEQLCTDNDSRSESRWKPSSPRGPQHRGKE